MYDEVENTMQIFNNELYEVLLNDNKFYLYFILGSFGVILLCLIIIISLIHSKGKVRKSICLLEKKLESRDREINMIKQMKENHKKNKKDKKNKAIKNIDKEENDDTETYNILKDD